MWTRLLVGLVALGGLVAYCSAPSSKAEGSPSTAEVARPSVRVATATSVSGADVQRFSGLTRATQRAALAFTIGGRLEARPVELGTRVRAGELLAHLDRAPLRNRVEAAAATLGRVEAQLAQGQRTQRRVRTLADAAALSVAEREEADSRVEVIDADKMSAAVELREAKRLLDEATLRAPFEGVVSEVRFEPGEFVVGGAPVVVLSGTEGVEVEIEVPERLLPRLRPHMRVRAAVPGLGGVEVAGTIASVAHAAPAIGRLFPVVVELEAVEGLVPGMAVELVLSLDEHEGVAVPVEAVMNPGGMHPSLFVHDGERVREVEVEVVRVSEGRAVVTGPIALGTSVVVSGQATLSDDEAVEAVQ